MCVNQANIIRFWRFQWTGCFINIHWLFQEKTSKFSHFFLLCFLFDCAQTSEQIRWNHIVLVQQINQTNFFVWFQYFLMHHLWHIFTLTLISLSLSHCWRSKKLFLKTAWKVFKLCFCSRSSLSFISSTFQFWTFEVCHTETTMKDKKVWLILTILYHSSENAVQCSHEKKLVFKKLPI